MQTVVPITAALLLLVAAAHLARLLFGVPLVISTTVIPMWPSAVGVVVPGILAVLLLRESRK